MGFQDQQLSIPGYAIADPKSVEMIRVWIAKHGLHCSLRPGYWKDNKAVDEESAWGSLLADVVKHIAGALNAVYGSDKSATVARIRESFLAESDKPTSGSAGDFVDGPSRN